MLNMINWSGVIYWGCWAVVISAIIYLGIWAFSPFIGMMIWG